MPIFDQSYRRWRGKLRPHTFRWWTITANGLRLARKKKIFLFIMGLAFLEFIIFATLGFIATNFGNPMQILTGEEFYLYHLQFAFLAFFLMAVYVGAGVISSDLKTNALQIYFSKPVTFADYILGKMGIIAFPLALMTVVPQLLLFILMSLFSPGSSYFIENLWIVAAIIGAGLVLIVPTSLVLAALSSLSRSNRFVVITFVLLLFGSKALRELAGALLRRTGRSDFLGFASFWDNLLELARFCFGQSLPSSTPIEARIAAHIALILVALWILRRRVRPVEVVR